MASSSDRFELSKDAAFTRQAGKNPKSAVPNNLKASIQAVESSPGETGENPMIKQGRVAPKFATFYSPKQVKKNELLLSSHNKYRLMSPKPVKTYTEMVLSKRGARKHSSFDNTDSPNKHYRGQSQKKNRGGQTTFLKKGKGVNICSPGIRKLGVETFNHEKFKTVSSPKNP